VDDAYSTNEICSDACAAAATSALDRPGVTLSKGDHGVVAGQVIKGGVGMGGLRQEFGPGNAIDVTIRMYEKSTAELEPMLRAMDEAEEEE
jgi:hypothetical protein